MNNYFLDLIAKTTWKFLTATFNEMKYLDLLVKYDKPIKICYYVEHKNQTDQNV